MNNNTQLRGIHQGFVIFAQSNKKGGNDGYFPGMDSSGNILPDGEATGYSGDGTEPASRLRMMLEGNFVTPDYIINPADTRAMEAEIQPGQVEYQGLTADHFSYAMLGLAEALRHQEGRYEPGDDLRAIEWKETLNTAAIVLSDRALGTDRKNISSVFTEPGSGDWRGGVVRNDNSTSFETQTEFEDTKYGNNDANDFDHIFEDEPNASDAFLVFEDAVTAYSKN
ncbi:hypothetical protein [Algisphaera agarilytica]|nr:hypothetical protein [Algisphaera agarilytica]